MATQIRSMEWVSERTGIPLNTLRYFRQQGTGPAAFKIGRRVFYDESDVEAWIESARKAGVGA